MTGWVVRIIPQKTNVPAEFPRMSSGRTSCGVQVKTACLVNLEVFNGHRIAAFVGIVKVHAALSRCVSAGIAAYCAATVLSKSIVQVEIIEL